MHSPGLGSILSSIILGFCPVLEEELRTGITVRIRPGLDVLETGGIVFTVFGPLVCETFIWFVAVAVGLLPWTGAKLIGPVGPRLAKDPMFRVIPPLPLFVEVF